MNINRFKPQTKALRFGADTPQAAAQKIKQLNGNTSVEGIRARQEILLAQVETNIEDLYKVVAHPDNFTGYTGRQVMLKLYERLLASMSDARPKTDPLDTLERLERLMAQSQKQEGET